MEPEDYGFTGLECKPGKNGRIRHTLASPVVSSLHNPPMFENEFHREWWERFEQERKRVISNLANMDASETDLSPDTNFILSGLAFAAIEMIRKEKKGEHLKVQSPKIAKVYGIKAYRIFRAILIGLIEGTRDLGYTEQKEHSSNIPFIYIGRKH